MGLTRGAFPILSAALLVSTIGAAGAEYALQEEPPFPDGAGKDVFINVCGLCHEPTKVILKQWTEKQWDLKVTEMLQEEPDVTAEERAAIVAYLTANFKPLSKIAVNKASAAELAKALGLSQMDAESILRYRAEKGPFKTMDDFKLAPGVDAAKLEAFKDRLEF